MSSSTWIRAELSSSRAPIDTTAWRAVEAQHRISTMKLVDSLEEQQTLENILEETKPPMPEGCEHLHWLLSAPFRYSAGNPHASRFRRAGAPQGVFYASASPDVAILEISFHRLLFFAESPNLSLPTNPAEYSGFAVQLRTPLGVDLTRPPMNAHRSWWMAPDDYTQCHLLADLARKDGITVIAYHSVRDPRHRMNYAVLSPAAFSHSEPILEQSWRIDIRAGMVVAVCESPRRSLTFSRKDFDVESRLRAAGTG